MKELRNQGDEAARIIQAHLQDGVEPPVGLSKHFEDFMKMVCTYYTKKDTVIIIIIIIISELANPVCKHVKHINFKGVL